MTKVLFSHIRLLGQDKAPLSHAPVPNQVAEVPLGADATMVLSRVLSDQGYGFAFVDASYEEAPKDALEPGERIDQMRAKLLAAYGDAYGRKELQNALHFLLANCKNGDLGFLHERLGL